MAQKIKKKFFIQGLKIVFKYLKKYKKDLIILSVLGIISAVANGIVPFVAGKLFDAIIAPDKMFIGTQFEMPLFLFLLIIWGGIKLLADIVDWRSGIRSEYMQNNAHAEYITHSYSTLLELPLAFHKNNKMGEITDKFNRATNWMPQIAGDIIINLTPQLLSVVVALAVSFYINKILCLVLVVGMLLYIATLFTTVQRFEEKQANKILATKKQLEIIQKVIFVNFIRGKNFHTPKTQSMRIERKNFSPQKINRPLKICAV